MFADLSLKSNTAYEETLHWIPQHNSILILTTYFLKIHPNIISQFYQFVFQVIAIQNIFP